MERVAEQLAALAEAKRREAERVHAAHMLITRHLHRGPRGAPAADAQALRRALGMLGAGDDAVVKISDY
jgi:hypothetical protein